MVPMSKQEVDARSALERKIERARLDIADNVWYNRAGSPFSNYYKVLARAFAREGADGVQSAVQKAAERSKPVFAEGETTQNRLASAAELMRSGRYEQAFEVLAQIVRTEPNNAVVHTTAAIWMISIGDFKNALVAMKQAVAVQPNCANYHANLAELHRTQGRLQEAEAWFRSALRLAPNDPEFMAFLGVTLAQQNRDPEALEIFRAALKLGAPLPIAHVGIGKIMAKQGDIREARTRYQAALAVAPGFPPACQALSELPGGTSGAF
jgi:Flp pilus assembly protein TadD